MVFVQSKGKQLTNFFKLQRITTDEFLDPTPSQTAHHFGTQAQISSVEPWVAYATISLQMKSGFYLFALFE